MPLRVLGADHHGALSVFPVVAGGVRAEGAPRVRLFADAVALGAHAREFDEPSVRDLVVVNPTDAPLLLLDGEEVVGAKQNRVFDGSVIVPAGRASRVAVCCVEENRWEQRRAGERFSVAEHLAHPSLRRDMTHTRVRSVQARSSQDSVWRSVRSLVEDSCTASATTALADVYHSRERALTEAGEALPLHQGQVAALAFLGPRFLAFDMLADPDAFAQIHPRLVRGYAVEALDHPPTTATDLAEAEHLLWLITRTRLHSARPAGIAERHTLGSDQDLVLGSVLTMNGVVMQASAFAR